MYIRVSYLSLGDPKLLLLGPVNKVSEFSEPSALVGLAERDGVRKHVAPDALHMLTLL